MCAHCESPEITRLNREAYDALQTMLADKRRAEVTRRPATTTRAMRNATRFRPMGMR